MQGRQRKYPKRKRYDDPGNPRMVQGDEAVEANKRFHDDIAAFRETFYGNERLLQEFPEVIEYLQRNMELIEEAKLSVGELAIRAKANAGANSALEEWKRAEASHAASTIGDLRKEKEDIENRERELEQKVEAYEVYTAERAIPRAINEAIQDKKLSHIPFVYYGWDSERLIATPATYEFLEGSDVPETLSLKELLRYVGKTNRKGDNVRHEFFRKIAAGKHIRYLPAETTTSGKEIHISGAPYHFSKKDPRVIGFGISFNEPRKMDYVMGTGLKGIHKAIESSIYSVHKRLIKLGLEA